VWRGRRGRFVVVLLVWEGVVGAHSQWTREGAGLVDGIVDVVGFVLRLIESV
jgi:hypothetical protein